MADQEQEIVGKILIVERSEMNKKLYEASMRSKRYDVVHCATNEEAYEILKDDATISDLCLHAEMLGRADGIRKLERILNEKQ